MVAIEFRYQKLEALNQVWRFLDNLRPETPKEKAMLSAMQDLASRFKRKQLTLEFKYSPSATYKVSLKDHEAYFLEMYLCDILNRLPLDYTRTVVYQYIGFINQKLA